MQKIAQQEFAGNEGMDGITYDGFHWLFINFSVYKRFMGRANKIIFFAANKGSWQSRGIRGYVQGRTSYLMC